MSERKSKWEEMRMGRLSRVDGPGLRGHVEDCFLKVSALKVQSLCPKNCKNNRKDFNPLQWGSGREVGVFEVLSVAFSNVCSG